MHTVSEDHCCVGSDCNAIRPRQRLRRSSKIRNHLGLNCHRQLGQKRKHTDLGVKQQWRGSAVFGPTAGVTGWVSRPIYDLTRSHIVTQSVCSCQGQYNHLNHQRATSSPPSAFPNPPYRINQTIQNEATSLVSDIHSDECYDLLIANDN
jgi:hypothetical protein